MGCRTKNRIESYSIFMENASPKYYLNILHLYIFSDHQKKKMKPEEVASTSKQIQLILFLYSILGVLCCHDDLVIQNCTLHKYSVNMGYINHTR